jgi:hypothetical protein
MDDLKEKLSAFGKVVECGGNDTTFTVHITTGFSNGAVNSFGCIKVINAAVGDKYPMVKSCEIDSGKFKYVLKTKD